MFAKEHSIVRTENGFLIHDRGRTLAVQFLDVVLSGESTWFEPLRDDANPGILDVSMTVAGLMPLSI